VFSDSNSIERDNIYDPSSTNLKKILTYNETTKIKSDLWRKVKCSCCLAQRYRVLYFNLAGLYGSPHLLDLAEYDFERESIAVAFGYDAFTGAT
jgi:hypothetical protein